MGFSDLWMQSLKPDQRCCDQARGSSQEHVCRSHGLAKTGFLLALGVPHSAMAPNSRAVGVSFFLSPHLSDPFLQPTISSVLICPLTRFIYIEQHFSVNKPWPTFSLENSLRDTQRQIMSKGVQVGLCLDQGFTLPPLGLLSIQQPAWLPQLRSGSITPIWLRVFTAEDKALSDLSDLSFYPLHWPPRCTLDVAIRLQGFCTCSSSLLGMHFPTIHTARFPFPLGLGSNVTSLGRPSLTLQVNKATFPTPPQGVLSGFIFSLVLSLPQTCWLPSTTHTCGAR